MRGRIEYGPGQPPVYRQLAGIVRDAIAHRIFRPGDLLPAERRLADEYEVGLDTVRDALAVLRAEGLIETKRGQGSRVRPPLVRTVIPLGKGARVSARMPTEEERRQLDLPEGVPVLVIRTAEGERILPADQHEAIFGEGEE